MSEKEAIARGFIKPKLVPESAPAPPSRPRFDRWGGGANGRRIGSRAFVYMLVWLLGWFVGFACGLMFAR